VDGSGLLFTLALFCIETLSKALLEKLHMIVLWLNQTEKSLLVSVSIREEEFANLPFLILGSVSY